MKFTKLNIIKKDNRYFILKINNKESIINLYYL